MHQGRPSRECGEQRALAPAVKRVMEHLFLVWLAGNLNCIPAAVCASPKSHLKRVSGQAQQRCQQCSTTSTMAWHVTTFPPPANPPDAPSSCVVCPMAPASAAVEPGSCDCSVCMEPPHRERSNDNAPRGCSAPSGSTLLSRVSVKSRNTLPKPEMRRQSCPSRPPHCSTASILPW
jgi:hypothetical protein